MRPLRMVTTTVLILLTVPALSEEKPADAKMKLVNEFVVVSGMEPIFGQVRRELSEIPLEVLVTDQKVSKAFSEAARAAAEKSYDPKVIGGFIRKRFAEDVEPEMLTTMIAYYRTDPGKRIAELEKQAAEPAIAVLVRQNETAILEKLEGDPDRKRLLTEVIDAIDAVNQAEAVVATVSYSMLAGMVASGKLPQTMTDDQISALVNNQLKGMREKLAKTILATITVVYKPLSNAELQTHLEALSTPAARRIQQVFYTAYGDVLGKESRKFGALLFKMLGLRDT